ncbi:retrovirus-related Pol polyprotein from transposon 412 [Trichonephila clavipes]|nr:retrovirus-related Pol polyprotein from transposon 412 [Trichonephila clavipes]
MQVLPERSQLSGTHHLCRRCSYGPRKSVRRKELKRPENLRELRSFLGLCTYYRKFVKGFSNIARPLHKLTESKQKFQWTKECEDSFLQLKEALTSSPILIYPQPDKPFILDTDASNESVGAVLSQEIDGQERVVAYWSKCLSKPERNYCVTRKELLAIVKAIEHFHHYLYGQKFLLRTDHASLTWLMNFRNTEGQVARWIQRLNEYYFDIRHRKGSSHGNADALSRRPCPENCRHCSRVETKYDYAIRQITTSTATPPDPWSDEKVREDQMADPDIKPLIEFMESSSNKPSWQDISAYSPTTKQYWALWNSLHLRNGVLYRKFESEDGKTFRWQLVLPRSRIPEVLKELHGSPTGGHFGVMKTLHRVRERFCWGKVRADVEQWCKSCDACSARKGPKIRSRGKLHRYNVGAPFERIAFDIPGTSAKDCEAPTVAEAVVQHWISRYGVPLQLHSDQGRNFVSAILKGVCELLGIDKTKTTPLHPQSDGMVERFNRTILNNLSLMVSKNQQDWDQKVPLFLLAYRSAVHETTGYSPSQMLFGRDLRLPCDLLFGRPPDTPSSPEEYVQNLQARFEDVHNLARERINLRTEKMKTRYDTKATGHQFKEDDKVWFYNPTRRKGLSPKLQSHWDGPYTILKINDVVIRILIYSQFGLAIHQNDHRARRRFVEWAQNEIAVVPDFHKRILFSDGAHFWLNGYVNKQNCRIWSEANPQVYVETPLHPEKLTVWCALWADGIIGPYFKNDEGHNVTVNGDPYRAMITNFFIPELNNHDVQELWFQQDGATCHTARATIDLLKDTFGHRLISRFGPVNWPPRSCDLTPLDYFLWGYVKSLVYADKPQTLDHLEDNIRRVIADIRPQMLEKVIENWMSRLTTSEPAVAVLCQKSYLKCNATRLSFE